MNIISSQTVLSIKYSRFPLSFVRTSVPLLLKFVVYMRMRICTPLVVLVSKIVQNCTLCIVHFTTRCMVELFDYIRSTVWLSGKQFHFSWLVTNAQSSVTVTKNVWDCFLFQSGHDFCHAGQVFTAARLLGMIFSGNDGISGRTNTNPLDGKAWMIFKWFLFQTIRQMIYVTLSLVDFLPKISSILLI